MTLGRVRSLRFLLLGAALLLIGGGALSFVLRGQFARDPDVQRFHAMVGKTEAEVRRTLGEPARVHEKATARGEYYEKGFTYERRPITNKVFIYFAEPDLIAYLYLDSANRVEHVFVGAS